MLRALVALLLLVNLGYFAWSEGWLDGISSSGARAGHEPERLAQQVNPDVIRILPMVAMAPAPAAVVAAAPAPSTQPVVAPAAASSAAETAACLQLGPFPQADVGAAEKALRAALPNWPPRGYQDVVEDRPGSWAVYMGRYQGAELLQQKEEELQRHDVVYEVLSEPPELSPGLLISRHDNAAAANEALANLRHRGVRSAAKVVVLSAPGKAHSLRIENADAALQRQLQSLNSPAFGKRAFIDCGAAAAAASAASAG
jgi:hypothetical protein